MPLYIDVGAVRIQRYINRWPTLRGRRGASALVTAWGREAGKFAIELHPSARVNEAAGAVDGVLSLELPSGTAHAGAMAKRALAWVRAKAPALELQASWAEGATYVDAFPILQEKLRDGTGLVGLPPTLEYPPGLCCEQCGLDHSVESRTLPEGKEKRFCPDCLAREDSQGGRSAEHAFMDRLDTQARAETLDDLARLGAGRKTNHLATIAIDGNALGSFFKEALGEASDVKDRLSRAMTAATLAALDDAARALPRGSRGELAVIPHVVGGDDVLATTPASGGWTFVRTFLTAFRAHSQAAVKAVAPRLLSRAPTASAGLVFAHTSHPFDRCQALAEGLLKQAKSFVGSRSAAVLWHDITRDGDHAPASRRPWLHADVMGREHALGRLAALGQSAQHELARVVAKAPLDGKLEDVEGAVRRLGHTDVVAPFLASKDVGLLAEALDIARWWS